MRHVTLLRQQIKQLTEKKNMVKKLTDEQAEHLRKVYKEAEEYYNSPEGIQKRKDDNDKLLKEQEEEQRKKLMSLLRPPFKEKIELSEKSIKAIMPKGNKFAFLKWLIPTIIALISMTYNIRGYYQNKINKEQTKRTEQTAKLNFDKSTIPVINTNQINKSDNKSKK